MPGGRVFSAGVVPNMNNNNILLQSQTARATSEHLFLSAPAPPFLGSRSMVSFEDVRGGKGCNGSFFRAYDPDENCDDGMDDYFHQPEKKRRLSADQVQFLEKSFEEDNKLEPERKTKLAKDLGLQPRQVAIWFQNRRARWKTKQLEKDYESLQASFDSLKANYDNLLKEKDRLKAEVANLTEVVVIREKQGGNDHLKLQAESTETDGLQEPSSSSEPQKPPLVVDSVSSEGEGSKVSVVGAACNKHEEISSVKRDILDSESPHYTDGVHSSSAPRQLEAGDSSYVFEPDQSDLSQDEEDNLIISKSFLHPYIFPKLEDVDYSDPPETSCNFGFPEEDHHAAFWPWSY